MRLTVQGTRAMRVPAGTRAALAAVAREMRPRGWRVEVVVGDDALLRRLNRRYRGLDRPTDVLAFAYGEAPAGAATPEAEIYVSLPRTRAQARARGHAVAAEFVLLVLHGLLHVQGHDHDTRAACRRMRRDEVRHLRRLRAVWPQLAPATPLLPPAVGKEVR